MYVVEQRRLFEEEPRPQAPPADTGKANAEPGEDRWWTSPGNSARSRAVLVVCLATPRSPVAQNVQAWLRSRAQKVRVGFLIPKEPREFTLLHEEFVGPRNRVIVVVNESQLKTGGREELLSFLAQLPVVDKFIVVMKKGTVNGARTAELRTKHGLLSQKTLFVENPGRRSWSRVLYYRVHPPELTDARA